MSVVLRTIYGIANLYSKKKFLPVPTEDIVSPHSELLFNFFECRILKIYKPKERVS